MSRPIQAAQQQAGYLLVAVLWGLLALTFVAVAISTRVEQLTASLLAQQVAQQESWADYNNENLLLYWLSTHRYSTAGIDLRPLQTTQALDSLVTEEGQQRTIRFDSTFYAGWQGRPFAVQDETALASVFTINRQYLERLQDHYGLRSPYLREAWLDQLEDWQDRDPTTRRLSGAQAADYQQAGLPLPAQRHFVSPGQIQQLLIYPEWQAAFDQAPPLSLLSTQVANQLNYNLTPRSLLEAQASLPEEALNRLFELREEQAFDSAAALNQALGVLLNSDPLSGFSSLPGRHLRLQLGAVQPYWVSISLQPHQNGGPWIINYRHLSPDPYPGMDTALPPIRRLAAQGWLDAQ